VRGWKGPGEAGSAEEAVAPPSIGAILDLYVTAEGLGELRAFERVVATWESVVGPDVARHVVPRTLKLGSLVVAVDHPSWATELRFIETEILRRLESQLGSVVVTSLRARVTP
jgi:predicted nucleic acid-binding Zn ribbon protein